MAIYDPTNAQGIIQPGGPGNAFKLLDPETDISAFSGGGRSYESDFSGTQPEDYRGTRTTSNPERLTGTISSRRRTGTIPAIRSLQLRGCLFNLAVLEGCDVKDKISLSAFQSGVLVVDAGPTSSSLVTDNGLSQRTDPSSSKVMDQLELTAAIGLELLPVAVSDISGTVATAALNDIIALGNAKCQGACGNENDGNQEFIAVGDAPGGGYTAPKLYYTANQGKSWTENTLSGIVDGAAVGVTIAGDNVLVACTGTNAGLYTMALADVKTGSATGTLVNGISDGTAINAVRAITATFIIAVGDSGAIYESVDGGFSFDQVGSGTTSENLADIAFADENLVWVCGANGALVKYTNQKTFALVTVDSTLSAVALNSIDVPPGRENELYVGAANGEIWRTRDTGTTFEERNFDKPASSSIVSVRFGGVKGVSLFVVQSNGSSQSRVLLDRSGGFLAQFAVVLGSFTSPSNATYNAIAPSDHNIAIGVGEIDSTYAAIVKVS